MIVFADFLLHMSIFIALFIPLFIFWKIYSKSKEEFAKKLFIPAIGLILIAIEHLLHSLMYFNIELIKDPFIESIFEHGSVIFLILTYAYFLLWFKKSYVDPIYGK